MNFGGDKRLFRARFDATPERQVNVWLKMKKKSPVYKESPSTPIEALRTYVKYITDDYYAWYTEESKRQFWSNKVFNHLAIVPGFAASIYAALDIGVIFHIHGPEIGALSKAVATILPALGSFAAMYIKHFRALEVMKALEDGRRAFDTIRQEGRILELEADNDPEKALESYRYLIKRVYEADQLYTAKILGDPLSLPRRK